VYELPHILLVRNRRAPPHAICGPDRYYEAQSATTNHAFFLKMI
jgi:hypothetical protein